MLDIYLTSSRVILILSETMQRRSIHLTYKECPSISQRDTYIECSQGVPIVQDNDQDSTDLMKCVQALREKEQKEGTQVSTLGFLDISKYPLRKQYDIIILGGLTGRLDQTMHTLSYLHKLRKDRKRVFTVTDDNIAWLLDEVSHILTPPCGSEFSCRTVGLQGEHHINVNHSHLGQTCGLLPVGIDQAILTTKGLKWNLSMR